MFGFDPIDLADPSPYLPLSYYGHIAIGTLALASALLAFFAAKGRRLHRYAGYAFVGAVAVVCITSIEMLANVFIPPLFMAVFTAIYAVGGAWLALRKDSAGVRTAEIVLALFEIAGLMVFLSIAIPAARAGIIPVFAPLVIAFIPLLLLAGDLNWFLRRSQRGRLRLARHLNRMIWASVVVLRAPMVELAAGGLPISQPFTIFAPILLGLALTVYFRWRHIRPRRTGRETSAAG